MLHSSELPSKVRRQEQEDKETVSSHDSQLQAPSDLIPAVNVNGDILICDPNTTVPRLSPSFELPSKVRRQVEEDKETVSSHDSQLQAPSDLIPAVNVNGDIFICDPNTTVPRLSPIYDLSSCQDSVTSKLFQFVNQFSSLSESFWLEFFRRYLNLHTFKYFMYLFHPVSTLSHHIDKFIFILLQVPLSLSSSRLLLLNTPCLDVLNQLCVLVCKSWKVDLPFIAASISLHLSPSALFSLLSGFYAKSDLQRLFTDRLDWVSFVLSLFSHFFPPLCSKSFNEWLFPLSALEFLKTEYEHSSFSCFVSYIKEDIEKLNSQYSVRCSQCSNGKHYFHSVDPKCAFSLKLDKKRFTICRKCDMHHVMLRNDKSKHDDIIPSFIYTKPCLNLKRCNSCLLFGHLNSECVFSKHSGINFKSFFTDADAKKFYHHYL
ncbi:hypothetical protein RCL1_003583 [Eukaryota sp. TZLM3-RCL]